jgi:hypothetical protein
MYVLHSRTWRKVDKWSSDTMTSFLVNFGLKHFSQFFMNLSVPQFLYKTTTGQNKIARQSRLDSKTKDL